VLLKKREKMVQISVAIRTRDEEEQLDNLLKALLGQTLLPSEVILVNNYSSGAALTFFENRIAELASLFKKKRIKIKLASFPDRDFSHAYSTNLGIFLAENELVAMTNAHALPISPQWLERGVKHFKNHKVACVTGYSFPFENNRSLSRLSRYVYCCSERIILRFDWTSTVNCIIRKSLWDAYPFDENLPKIIPASEAYGCEDYDWSKEMKARGFKTIVDSDFSIFHSHKSGVEEAKRNVRIYVTHRRIQQLINRLERPRKAYTRLKDHEKPNSICF
jgi:GT2 family glycosyltransferase